MFVNWLYTQRVEDKKGKLPRSGPLVNLWLLADLFIMPKLQNQILLELDKSRRRISAPCTANVSEYTQTRLIIVLCVST